MKAVAAAAMLLLGTGCEAHDGGISIQLQGAVPGTFYAEELVIGKSIAEVKRLYGKPHREYASTTNDPRVKTVLEYCLMNVSPDPTSYMWIVVDDAECRVQAVVKADPGGTVISGVIFKVTP